MPLERARSSIYSPCPRVRANTVTLHSMGFLEPPKTTLPIIDQGDSNNVCAHFKPEAGGVDSGKVKTELKNFLTS